jgi:hypothetical protein
VDRQTILLRPRLHGEAMSHQVLSPQQFNMVPDLPVEKSIDSPDPQNIEPEKEDQDVGQKNN